MAEHDPKVLVVDDELFFREAIRDILAAEELEVVEAEDGESALELADDPAVGVAVLDIRLPGIDGLEVLRRLRARNSGLRVIMLSAHTDQELVLDALRLGACDYLAKPLHDEELVLAVRRAAESFALSMDWGRLRGRLDRLAAHMESLTEQVGGFEGEERVARVGRGATEAAAAVLEAAKTSLMLVDAAGSELRVSSACGRSVEAEEMDPVAVGEGAAGVACAEGRAILVGEVEAEPRFAGRAPDGRYDSQSFAIAPLGPGDQPIGVLCATDRAGGGAFSEEDLALLRLLALQTGQLMHAAPAELPAGGPVEPSGDADERRQPSDAHPEVDRDAELARRVCEAVVAEVEPDRVLSGVLRPLSVGLPAAPASIFLLDGATGMLRCESSCDGGMRAEREELPTEKGLTGQVVRTGQMIASDAPQTDPRFDPEVDTPADGEAGPMLCVPLALRGKIVGVFRAFLREDAPASARTGEVLAAALSAAIRNVLLYRSLLESIEEVAEARREARR